MSKKGNFFIHIALVVASPIYNVDFVFLIDIHKIPPFQLLQNEMVAKQKNYRALFSKKPFNNRNPIASYEDDIYRYWVPK